MARTPVNPWNKFDVPDAATMNNPADTALSLTDRLRALRGTPRARVAGYAAGGLAAVVAVMVTGSQFGTLPADDAARNDSAPSQPVVPDPTTPPLEPGPRSTTAPTTSPKPSSPLSTAIPTPKPTLDPAQAAQQAHAEAVAQQGHGQVSRTDRRQPATSAATSNQQPTTVAQHTATGTGTAAPDRLRQLLSKAASAARQTSATEVPRPAPPASTQPVQPQAAQRVPDQPQPQTRPKPTPAGKSPEKALTRQSYHTVRAGQTLSQIAKAAHLNLSQLKALNQLTTDRIHVGDKLRLHTAVPVKPRARPAAPPRAPQPSPAQPQPKPTQPGAPAPKIPTLLNNLLNTPTSKCLVPLPGVAGCAPDQPAKR